jgi:uncharacterized membrane protein affecting hemolysin expression
MQGQGNAGFVNLMTPIGLLLLVLFFCLLVAVIAFGSAWIKLGEQNARNERARLKELKAERDRRRQREPEA